MNLRRIVNSIIFTFTAYFSLVAQPTSYQLELDSLDCLLHNVMINQNNKVVALLRELHPTIPSMNHYIVPITGENQIEHGYKMNFFSSWVRMLNSLYFNNRIIFTCWYSSSGSFHRLISLNLQNGTYWAKRTKPDQGSMGACIKVDKDGNVVFASGVYNYLSPYFQDGVLEIYKLDSLGNTIWQKGLILNSDSIGSGQGIFSQSIEIDVNGEIYLTGRLRTGSYSEGLQFLLKLDQFGNPLVWKTFTNREFSTLTLTADALFVFDKPSSALSGYSNYENAILLKLDKDLNVLWARKYSAENFGYESASLKSLPPNKLLMSHSTTGAYPVVLTEIDSDGNILSQKGYPNHTAYVDIMEDGSILLASQQKFDSSGQLTDKMIFAKTDVDGNIAGCTTYPTCITVEDFDVHIGNLSIDTIDVFDLESFTMSVEPHVFTFSPYCEYPAPPSPIFEFPDTLCVGGFGRTTNTYNHLAQTREWHLLGPGVDTILTDSTNFSFNFVSFGDFKLMHTIWVLGCKYSFEKTITILPPLKVDIFPEYICPDSSYKLYVSSNRPLNEYTWDSGLTTSTIAVNTEGTYSIIASDGFCESIDTASVYFVSNLINGIPPFSLPDDANSCMPYKLIPESSFTNQFFTSTDTTLKNTIILDTPGTYRIGMTAFGCTFWDTFKYDMDCHVDVYLPTSFSPNGDGINDEFRPFGNDFEVLELSVFDRWGGLRYKGTAWDGANATQGSYVFLLRYRNLKSNEIATISGEVALVK
ncbi:MAG: gliding motility-associated C-terminal domain-containing protein [Saprospiraceae bacterium]|nr:gliding motility-associated C-terminal domain-containing protein [Saprospiraceae bacterium]